jgi:hypothetical protein
VLQVPRWACTPPYADWRVATHHAGMHSARLGPACRVCAEPLGTTCHLPIGTHVVIAGDRRQSWTLLPQTPSDRAACEEQFWDRLYIDSLMAILFQRSTHQSPHCRSTLAIVLTCSPYVSPPGVPSTSLPTPQSLQAAWRTWTVGYGGAGRIEATCIVNLHQPGCTGVCSQLA